MEHFPVAFYPAGIAGSVVLAGPPRDPAPVDQWLDQLTLSVDSAKKLRNWLKNQPTPSLAMYTAVWEIWEKIHAQPVSIIVPPSAGVLARHMMQNRRFWASWQARQYRRNHQPHTSTRSELAIERYQTIVAAMAQGTRKIGADTFYRWGVAVSEWHRYHKIDPLAPLPLPFPVDPATETLMIPQRLVEMVHVDAQGLWHITINPGHSAQY